VFTARYAQSPYVTQINFVSKRLNSLQGKEMWLMQEREAAF